MVCRRRTYAGRWCCHAHNATHNKESKRIEEARARRARRRTRAGIKSSFLPRATRHAAAKTQTCRKICCTSRHVFAFRLFHAALSGQGTRNVALAYVGHTAAKVVTTLVRLTNQPPVGGGKVQIPNGGNGALREAKGNRAQQQPSAFSPAPCGGAMGSGAVGGPPKSFAIRAYVAHASATTPRRLSPRHAWHTPPPPRPPGAAAAAAVAAARWGRTAQPGSRWVAPQRGGTPRRHRRPPRRRRLAATAGEGQATSGTATLPRHVRLAGFAGTTPR